MKKWILLLLFSLFASIQNIHASEQLLTVTDNDDNDEIYNFVVDVDDTTQSLISFYKDTYVDGEKTNREILDPENLKTEDGVILEERNGYNALNLKSDNFDPKSGGKIEVDTLYNGATGERRSIYLDLARGKNGWKLFKDKNVVSQFHVKVNRVIILGAVGIKTIIME